MSKIYQRTHPAGKSARFTLIKLLVFVLIIGILAAVVWPLYEVSVEKNRITRALAVLKKISDNIEICSPRIDYCDFFKDLPLDIQDANNAAGKDFNYVGWYMVFANRANDAYSIIIIPPAVRRMGLSDTIPDRFCMPGKNNALGLRVCRSLSGGKTKEAEGVGTVYPF